jgi:hypothetical protein
MFIAIILLNWNGKKDTLECLSSLQKVDYPHFQTLIVDNGSTDDSVAAIQEAYPNIPLLKTKANLGFAGGNNKGIEWALKENAEWILLLNNDTVVAPDLLKAFLSESAKQPKAKILGAKILRYQQRNVIDHLGGFWNSDKAEFDSPDSGKKDHPHFNMIPVDYVCGAALFMHRSVPETIGLLEAKFFLFWEETDFCYRARRAGFEVWTAPAAKILHKVSSSFTGGKPHTQYFYWRSRLLWLERNCTPKEKKRIYRRIIIPEVWKMARHFLLKSLLPSNPARKEKMRRNRAGCAGVIDYLRGRFGNCPQWLLKK